MKSMTGYGTSKDHKSDIEIEVSIKTVNGRFLDIRMHIPKEYADCEGELKKTIGQTIRRGTVDVYLSRRVGALAQQAKVVSQPELAKKWAKAYRQLGKELGLPDDLRLEAVARLPDVLTIEHFQKVSDQEQALMRKVLQKTLANCQKEREREGRSLQKDLLSKLKELSSLVKVFEDLKAQTNEELAQRYEQRLKKYEAGGEIDPQRLAQEIVIQVDKADVSEEITRLTEHIRSMKELVEGDESQGKKLDFYTQELLREVNTVGSKSQNARLTKSVVDAKAIVERIREQVQNVE